MKIYKYLSEEVKNEINKSIKSKLNAEDVAKWQEEIEDEYYSSMFDECSRLINNNPQYDVNRDYISGLAKEYAEAEIDRFIDYCIYNDYDPYKVWSYKCTGIEYGGIFANDTFEEMLDYGCFLKI